MKLNAVTKLAFYWSNSTFGGAGMVTVLHLPSPPPSTDQSAMGV